MIDLKELLEIAGPEKLEYIVTVNGNPVWDYKMAGYDTVLLIEHTQDGIEEEYVSLLELKKYVVNCEIPFGIAKFKVEETQEFITSFKWDTESKELCLLKAK
tara:strand:+ start:1538 stop:1843 length:306 start_codon:yes stop_codon:yes gene_type:complete